MIKRTNILMEEKGKQKKERKKGKKKNRKGWV
jgi:hypothetical protein